MIHELLQEVHNGNAVAQQRFVDEYGPHILRVVRGRLNRKLRAKFDSMDFVQDVWASFFAHLPPPDTWPDPDKLAHYLVRMASNKMGETYRQRFLTDRYNLLREEIANPRQAETQCFDDNPTASQVIAAQDEWDHWLQELPDHYRQVLELRRAGHSYEEIASQTGMAAKTVCRVVQKLQSALQASSHASYR
jgi:RNA polymerase sigma factor (sigma-70 family)